MRICITCVYWTLLFISVVSSALLFLIVASESVQTNYYSTFNRNETSEIYDNDTFNRIEDDTSESSHITVMKLQDPANLEAKDNDHYYHEQFNKEATKFETITNGEARKKENPYKDPDIVAETLTQQPNLSQGISETEQAAVLTLTDTAAAELQNLAEPKIRSEFPRARSFAKNSSLLTQNLNIGQKTKHEPPEIFPSTQVPSPSSIVHENTEKPTENNVFEEETLLLPKSINEETSDIVVVVRAEQAPITTDESDLRLENDVGVKIHLEDTPKVAGTFASSVSNDTELKDELGGGMRDDPAVVFVDEGIVSVGSTDSHEDIPSFSEWTQKRLEEAEKKKTHPNTSAQNAGVPTRGIGGMKMRSKNYASPDCGAKIVAANPEAQSARSVLAFTRDEYMLNTCTSRIWFVVELCEAIQAKKIELANFELFSSSPKDFSVYISDRFPTRDWSSVGQFTAKDVKDVQSFVLEPHLFGKFIKIELQTYYGSEHFCPISLFRAYGTSEFEVLETETENQVSRETNTNADDEDSDEEDLLDTESGDPPRNLFGSARDAVLSIVKKAAEVLVISSELTGNNITKIQQSIDNDNILENSFATCTTPRYTILCRNCSDHKFANVFQLISCKERQLYQMLEIDFVNKTLRHSRLCELNGVVVESSAKKNMEESNDEKFDSMKSVQMAFVTSVFKSEYIVALCNILAIKERKMVMNMSHEVPCNNSKDTGMEDALNKDGEEYNNDAIKSVQHSSATSTLSSSADNYKTAPSKEFQRTSQEVSSEETDRSTGASIGSSPNSENLASQVKSTKTFGKEEARNDSSVPVLESSKGSIKETIQPDTLTGVPVSSSIGHHSTFKNAQESSITLGTATESLPQSTISVPVTAIDNEISNENIVSSTDTLEPGCVQSKVERTEHLDQERKQGQEILDQDIKQLPQDSLTFDTLLSDLKDLDGEMAQIQNGPAASASIMQSTTSTMPQKESVFLRLSNRIKALERNMSLSGQYLEELSRRYKKQVEEMQRSLERTVSAMSEETRKREERELQRAEEIAVLRKEVALLSKSINNLLYDRDSWRGKLSMIAQHVLLLCSEVFVVFVIFTYCRGNRKSDANKKGKPKKNELRRKSAEHFSSHVKKLKKRRPSEIASHITGTYRELMIDDKSHETKKEKKKKRKREALLTNNKANLNNDAKGSSIAQCTHVVLMDEVIDASDFQKHFSRGLKSDLESEHNVQLIIPRDESFETDLLKSSEFHSHGEHFNNSNSLNVFSETTASGDYSPVESPRGVPNSENSSEIIQDIQLSATPSFMKTALSMRKRRKVSSNDVNGEWNQKPVHDNSARVSPTVETVCPEQIGSDSDTTTNTLFTNQSDESRSSSITSMSKRKEKKSTGFRKMVRKFF